MAHFYGEVHGNRGAASRLGSAASGMEARAQGWTVGATVRAFVDPATGEDTVQVYRTDGSNGYRSNLIAEFTANTKRGKEGDLSAKGAPPDRKATVPIRFCGLLLEAE